MLESGTAQTLLDSIVSNAVSFSGVWVIVAWLLGIGFALWIFEYLVDLVDDTIGRKNKNNENRDIFDN